MTDTTFTYSALKKRNNLELIEKEINKLSTKRNKDERFWSLKADDTGTGTAVIRFLPSPPADGKDGTPWVRYRSHWFKGPGGIYAENSRFTFGEPDPAQEHANLLYNSSNPGDKKLYTERKAKINHICNIYVVKDPANPENEGKVFLYRFGPQIFDVIKNMYAGVDRYGEEKEIVDVFDLEKGANFRLRQKRKGDFPSFEDSEFDAPSALGKSEKERIEIWEKAYPLQDFIAPDKFKSFDELQARLDKVLGKSSKNVSRTRTYDDDDEDSYDSSDELDDGDEMDSDDFLNNFDRVGR